MIEQSFSIYDRPALDLCIPLWHNQFGHPVQDEINHFIALKLE
jgi:hypothetical protein